MLVPDLSGSPDNCANGLQANVTFPSPVKIPLSFGGDTHLLSIRSMLPVRKLRYAAGYPCARGGRRGAIHRRPFCRLLRPHAGPIANVLNLFDLRAFAHIAELKSLSAAARALKMPNSSVSRALARLEAELGTLLVERSTHHLHLTDAGVLLHPLALRILSDVNDVETTLSTLAVHPRGSLRVNAAIGYAHGLVAPMLPAFLDQYPDVRVVLDVDNRRIDMLREEADLVIRTGRLTDSKLVARRLATLAVWTCASSAYLERRGMPAAVSDLGHHDLIGRIDGAESWVFHTTLGQPEVFEVDARAVVTEPAVLRVVLAGGAGIGRLPDFMAADAIQKGDLVRVLPGLRPETVHVHALYPSHRGRSPKVRAFIDMLVAHLEATRSRYESQLPSED
jgi:DNA-binding transcriptional LysR family regulator